MPTNEPEIPDLVPTEGPYPPPVPTDATPTLLQTAVPDATLVAMSNQDFAVLGIDWLNDALVQYPAAAYSLQGPFEVVATADVNPGDMSDWIEPESIAKTSYPDIAIIYRGRFRELGNPDGPELEYRLYVADRTTGFYFNTSSNDLSTLQAMLP
jgi:hypothetical protein